ncbi:TonB family protein [Phenylobacterium sp.]|uniref:TonB family protein n=1 Tax=Phenylobacterium sp. TaxID=1871053 RepID=UPI0025F40D43|nr:TonB family protein [Phenylobacterium sp.]
MRIYGAAAVAALAAIASPASAAPPVSSITNPDWITLPGPTDFDRLYPKIASALTVEGYAVIGCRVNVRGELEDCGVQLERPKDLGFGKAALAMSASFKMRPQTVNGLPVDGGKVRIPIRFSLPGERPGPPPQPPAGDDLTQAYRIVDSLRLSDQAVDGFEANARRIEFTPDPSASEAVRGEAADALRAALQTHKAEFRENAARAYASVFSQGELAAMADFAEAPASRALTDNATYRTMIGLVFRDALRATLAYARDAYCSDNKCLSPAEVERVWRPDRAKGVIDNPQWIEAPSEQALRLGRPPGAALLNLSGAVRLTCALDDDDRPLDCVVEDQAPANLGFGDAAKSLAPKYRLNSVQRPSRTPATGVVVRVGFGATESDAAFQPPPARSAAALDLARQLQDVDALSTQFEAGANTFVSAAEHGTEFDKSVARAFRDALRKVEPELLEHSATLMAAEFTEEQLASLLRFRTSPAGKAQAERTKELATALGNAWRYVAWRIDEDAHARFCESRECVPPPSATAPPPPEKPAPGR